MRSLLFVMIAALLLCGSAFAQPSAGAAECDVYYWDEVLGDWVPNGAVDERNARLYRAGEAWEGNCNARIWSHEFTVYASIAQWVDFDLAWSRWEWFVRKPGTYAGDGIEATIASNGDVGITFSGFANLTSLTNTDANPIEAWYGFSFGGSSQSIDDIQGWIPADQMNGEEAILVDAYDPDYPYGGFPLHDGLTWFLWNKIHVINCNSACEYENVPTVTLTLLNQKDWIDDDGDWYMFP